MAHLHVLAPPPADERVQSLTIATRGLPDRTIDRETAIAWMRDGHSLVPFTGSAELPALLLMGDEDAHICANASTPDVDTVPGALAGA